MAVRFVIEIDVEIPDARLGVWARVLKKMEINDSVGNLTIEQRNCFYSSAKYLKRRIVSRKEKCGYRIWRVA